MNLATVGRFFGDMARLDFALAVAEPGAETKSPNVFQAGFVRSGTRHRGSGHWRELQRGHVP